MRTIGLKDLIYRQIRLMNGIRLYNGFVFQECSEKLLINKQLLHSVVKIIQEQPKPKIVRHFLTKNGFVVE
jgi:hypothetical protein